MIFWVSESLFGCTARVTSYVDVSLEQVIRRDLWSGFGERKNQTTELLSHEIEQYTSSTIKGHATSHYLDAFGCAHCPRED